MEAIVGFQLDIWDYLTFLAVLVLVVAGLAIFVFIMGLPGRVAIARKHPEAEAVNLLGWYGFFGLYPWLKALVWAFKPTDVIDIRYTPKEEKRDIEEQIARLTGKKAQEKTPEPKEPK